MYAPLPLELIPSPLPQIFRSSFLLEFLLLTRAAFKELPNPTPSLLSFSRRPFLIFRSAARAAMKRIYLVSSLSCYSFAGGRLSESSGMRRSVHNHALNRPQKALLLKPLCQLNSVLSIPLPFKQQGPQPSYPPHGGGDEFIDYIFPASIKVE